MAKNLIIVESPTKTKTISKILGKNYEVMASKGHLRDLPKSQFGVDIEHQFQPKYINVRGKAPLINELKKAAGRADKVYLATDPDREGEAISWHLSHLLSLNPEDNIRVSFTEITEGGVKEGMKALRPIDQKLVDAQQARRVMDRIVGYGISPILWKKVRGGLSAGRVQSVALKLIVDREREIQAFKAEEYWSVHAHHCEQNMPFESELVGRIDADGRVEKTALSNEQQAQDVCQSLGTDFVVRSIDKKKKSRKPYAPFTTSTLQQEASKRLGFSTSKTMSVAQQLYEGISAGTEGQVGLITYMRTDSTRLSAQFIQEALELIGRKYGAQYQTRGVSYNTKRANAQDAHEAIRPAAVTRSPESLKQFLTNDQYRLYELIWNRAVASQMKPSQFLSTSVDLICSGWLFHCNGAEPIFDGFQRVWPMKETSVYLPSLAEGQVVRAISIEKKQHFTQPPARYSEASLVQTLEKNGIGRPSTYAATIKSILQRRYVRLEKKQFYPTDLGVSVLDLLVKNFSSIINEKFTARMEERLDEVAEGKQDWRELMASFYDIFTQALEQAKKDDQSYRVEDKPTGEVCPQCGSPLVYKHGRNGDFIGCSAFPKCDFTKNIVKETGVVCPKCGGAIVEKISKRGKLFYSCANYPKCDYASWDKPTGEKCPLCGDLMVHRKNRREDRVFCHNEECPNHN
ncbi:MAG: type I DNA topoisomerase [Ndongobacter sp.]|nr:type I DNA topoisomerase [Ndongobacter sp.]